MKHPPDSVACHHCWSFHNIFLKSLVINVFVYVLPLFHWKSILTYLMFVFWLDSLLEICILFCVWVLKFYVSVVVLRLSLSCIFKLSAALIQSCHILGALAYPILGAGENPEMCMASFVRPLPGVSIKMISNILSPLHDYPTMVVFDPALLGSFVRMLY